MTISVNQQIMDMLKNIELPVAFGAYTGTDKTYIVWNFADERGMFFADGVAQYDLVSIQVHLFAPKTVNHVTKKKEIKELLITNGWSHPIISTMYESESSYFHIVFSTEKEIENG